MATLHVSTTRFGNDPIDPTRDYPPGQYYIWVELDAGEEAHQVKFEVDGLRYRETHPPFEVIPPYWGETQSHSIEFQIKGPKEAYTIPVVETGDPTPEPDPDPEDPTPEDPEPANYDLHITTVRGARTGIQEEYDEGPIYVELLRSNNEWDNYTHGESIPGVEKVEFNLAGVINEETQYKYEAPNEGDMPRNFVAGDYTVTWRVFGDFPAEGTAQFSVVATPTPTPDPSTPIFEWQAAGLKSITSESDVEVIDHQTAFELAQGSIALEFNLNDVQTLQGLLSKDATGLGLGGDLSISVKEGRMEVRLQSALQSYYLFHPVVANTTYKVVFTFGPSGMKLYVNGLLRDTDGYTGGLTNNTEPMVFGAGIWSSDRGGSSPIKSVMNGELGKVAIYDSVIVPDDGSEPIDSLVSEQDWEDGLDGGWTLDAGTANYSEADDAGDGYGEADFPTSLSPGTAPIQVSKVFSSEDEILVKIDWWLSSNFDITTGDEIKKILTLQSQSIHPITLAISGATPDLTVLLEGSAESPEGGLRWDGVAANPSLNTKHEIELYVKLNTVDSNGDSVADGVLAVFLDGTEIIYDDDVRYRGNDSSIYDSENYWRPTWGIDGLRWKPTWPAGGSSPGVAMQERVYRARVWRDDSELTAVSGTPSPAPTSYPPSVTPPDTDQLTRLFGIPTGVPDAGFQSDYDDLFDHWAPIHFVEREQKWQLYYYDRALLAYMKWRQTGDDTWLQHGHRWYKLYRDGYLIPNNGNSSPRWTFPDGQAIHYAITGDPKTLDMIENQATRMQNWIDSILTTRYRDGRIQGRAILSNVLAYEMTGKAIYADKAGEGITDMLTWFDAAGGNGRWDSEAVGSHTGENVSYCGGMATFTICHAIIDCFVRYHQLIEPVARLNEVLEATLDFTYDNHWHNSDPDPKNNGFSYIQPPASHGSHTGFSCEGSGSSGVAKDVSLLCTPAFGYGYSFTGLTRFKTYGDEVWAHGTSGSVEFPTIFMSGSKQFNQSFFRTRRYLHHRTL